MATPQPFDVLFCVPSSELPKPLPSAQDAEASTDILQDRLTRRTVRVCGCYVVKYGSGVKPIEGNNMLFVQKHTQVPIPRLFAIYQRLGKLGPKATITYLVMEHIPGTTLEALWRSLTDDKKKAMARRLRECFGMLRRVPSPGFFGSIEEGKLTDSLFWTKEEIRSLNGPFATSTDMVEAMVRRYVRDVGDRVVQKAAYYRRVLPRVLKADASVFTHDDLQPRNVIVRPGGEVVIVDWASAGWYPDYWEYATAMFAVGSWRDDWHAYVGQILDEFPNQYAWLNTLRIEMWG